MLLQGLMWTCLLSACSIAFSLVGGVPLAVASISRNRAVRSVTRFFLWIFRGTPLLLQLFLIYFGLPQIGIYLSPMTSGIIGLGLHYAVYNADVMRTGIVAIESGQHEASRSLGLSRGRDHAQGHPAPGPAQCCPGVGQQSDCPAEGIGPGIDHHRPGADPIGPARHFRYISTV